MEVKVNPTGRLLDILVNVRAKPDTLSARKVWAAAFDCEPSDTGAILGCLADLIKLLEEAKEATKRFVPGDLTIYLAPFPKIEAMLSRVHLDNTWQPSKVHLDEKTMSGLEFGDHMLTQFYGNNSLSGELIHNFITQLNELLQQCLSSDLPLELKKIFVKNLEALRHALMAYKLSGADGLIDEIDRTAGSLFRYRDDIQAASSEAHTKEFTTKFFDMISKLNDSVQIVQNAAYLVGPAAGGIAMLLQQINT
ncbi:hypothetical protein [Pseudomonas moraviensis]